MHIKQKASFSPNVIPINTLFSSCPKKLSSFIVVNESDANERNVEILMTNNKEQKEKKLNKSSHLFWWRWLAINIMSAGINTELFYSMNSSYKTENIKYTSCSEKNAHTNANKDTFYFAHRTSSVMKKQSRSASFAFVYFCSYSLFMFIIWSVPFFLLFRR